MNNKTYPIHIYWQAEEDGSGYWMAYLPDFGESACSAAGDTIAETLSTLEEVRENVVLHYQEKGVAIPQPTKPPGTTNRQSIIQYLQRLARRTRERAKDYPAVSMRKYIEYEAEWLEALAMDIQDKADLLFSLQLVND